MTMVKGGGLFDCLPLKGPVVNEFALAWKLLLINVPSGLLESREWKSSKISN